MCLIRIGLAAMLVNYQDNVYRLIVAMLIGKIFLIPSFKLKSKFLLNGLIWDRLEEGG